MKKENKLARAFAAADEELFAAAENTAFAPSADFERRANAIVRKKNGVTWRFVNTTGKKVAAAALALLLVAAAVFAVPAVRRQFGKNSVTEDANILYRSENGDVTVRVVEPLDAPIKSQFLFLPITEEKLNSMSEVFIGTVETVEEIEVTYELDGQLRKKYLSLLTVSVDEKIKRCGEVTEGSCVSLLFGFSTHFTNEDGIYPVEGKKYTFFLRKTSETVGIVDYSDIADYIYKIPCNAFIPTNEPQLTGLLDIIGAEKGAFGEEYITALRRFYE